MNINDDVTCVPAKGSQVKSLKSFTLTWDNYDAKLNPDCTEQITYGYGEGTATIAANGDGSFTITLDKEYTTNGWVTVEFPEGLFLLSADGLEVPSGSLSVTYNVSVYVVVPGLYTYVSDPIDSVTVYADGIQLVGNVSDIIVYDTETQDEDWNNVKFTEGASSEEVTDELNGEGIKVTFAKAYETAGSVEIVIPAGTFSFDGATYDEEIYTFVTLDLPVILPEPTVTPADGATVEELATVTLSWNDSPMYQSYSYEEIGDPFTLTFTADETAAPVVTDITEYVEIVSDEVDNGIGFPQINSSEIVITFPEAYTAEGKYVISIPEGYAELENYQYTLNPALTLTYFIGDTNSIAKFVDAEDGFWTVYTTTGVLVTKTADAATLGNLAPGLYIINGQKMFIKK